MTTKNADPLGPATKGKCYFGGKLDTGSTAYSNSTAFEKQKSLLSDKPLFRPKQGQAKK